MEEFEKRRNSVSSAHVSGTSFYCGSMNREMKRYTKGKPSTSPLFLSLFLHNNNFSYVNESENFSPCLGSSKDGNDFTICYSNYFNFLEESWNEVVITFFIL